MPLTWPYPVRRTGKHAELRHNLRNSIADGAAFNLMVGLGETYFPAFILAVGLGQVASGLITTVPLLAGAFLQLFSPVMLARLRSYRKWVLICASIQAAAFLPFIWGAYTGQLSLALAFLVAAIYWGFGMAAGPAWNSWIGTLVPARIQTAFFTRRSFWTQVTALCGFLVGGVALRLWPSTGPIHKVFAGFFAVALFCRVLSIRWLSSQTEPIPPNGEGVRWIAPVEFFRRVRTQGNLGRVFRYLLLVQLTTQIASPYFTPYMLGELKFSYATYVMLVAASYVTKIIVLPSLGRIASAQGTRALIWLGGSGVILLPALWLISYNFYYLLGLQILSGFFWGAYELASLLLLLELIDPPDRATLLCGYNFLNAFVVVLGSLTGGALLHFVGGTADAYIVVFSLSALGRATTLLWLRRVSYHRSEWIPLVFRPLVLRPSLGFQGQPLTAMRQWRLRVRREPPEAQPNSVGNTVAQSIPPS